MYLFFERAFFQQSLLNFFFFSFFFFFLRYCGVFYLSKGIYAILFVLAFILPIYFIGV